MKKLNVFLVFAILVSSAVSCTKEEPEVYLPGEIELDLKSKKIIEADNQFGLELLQLVNNEEDNKNLMISPLSISLALAMAYNGAEGNTQDQMEKMLHKIGMTPDEINHSYKSLVDALESHDPKVELSIANAIFYHENYTIKNNFITTNRSYYNAEIDDLNFSNTSATLDRVNGWVKDKTRDKIGRIIENVSPDDVMYLINAIYFNGEWSYRFDDNNTADRIFFLEDGSEIMTPTMYLEETFNYLNTDKFELLEMPYGGKKYSMLIFLPFEDYSTNDVIEEIDPDKLQTWISNMNGWNKRVFLPKFEFAYENSLIDNLKALGMTDAFQPRSSDFSGITDDTDLYISEVKHKSYIKVDERGTEAAAVTGVTIETTSIQPHSIFAVDRPFVFAIREKDTNAILFLGKVVDPTKDQ